MNFKLNFKSPHVRNILIISAVGAASIVLWYQFVFVGIQRDTNNLKAELTKYFGGAGPNF